MNEFRRYICKVVGRRDWAEGEIDPYFCDSGASVDSAGSSEDGMVLQSCPILRHVDQTFVSLHEPVIGHRRSPRRDCHSR